MGLAQLDEFFGYDENHPGPSVRSIGTDTARAFIKARQAENPPAGNAVINRTLAALRRMLRVFYEDQKQTSLMPVIRLLKEPQKHETVLSNLHSSIVS